MKLNEQLKQKAKIESQRIFELLRKEGALTSIRGKTVLAASEETLETILFNAMVDGASIMADQIKPSKES